jgi:small subunit ribosomal protein S10
MTPPKKATPKKVPAPQPSPRTLAGKSAGLRPAGKKAAKKPAPSAAKKLVMPPSKESVAVLEKKEPPAHAPAPKKPVETKAAPSIRIRLSAFDHTVLDEAAAKIIDTAERTGAVVHGPIPLPTKIRKFTVNRATFKFKDARDQFEMRTHRRLIDLKETTFKTMESLQSLSLPSGVDIEIKMG